MAGAMLDAAAHEVRRLPKPARRAVTDQLGSIGTELLDVDLTRGLLTAWQGWGVLAGAADRSLANPDRPELAMLDPHVVKSTYRPSIGIFVNRSPKPALTLQLGVAASLEVHGLVAVLDRGALTEVRSGVCTVTVAADCAGAVFARSAPQKFSLSNLVRLRRPVQLSEDVRYRARLSS